MSFLPGSLTPAFRSPWCAHIMASLRRRTYLIRTVIQLLDVEKQKEPITQSIKNRREHSSRFKVMFYVIGSEIQSRVLLSTAPANRTKGVVEQFGTSGVPIPCRIKPTYGGTLVFSCATIIQIHHLFVKILNISHCIRNFKEQFSTGSKKIPLLVRTFRSDLSTGLEKHSSYTSRRNFKIRTLLNIFFAPFFQGVLNCFLKITYFIGLICW